MRANNAQVNLNDDRKKEYERQQEKLKAMANAVDKVKPVSADLMIENLLKDSFKKPSQIQTNNEPLDQTNSELPIWLICESAMVPPQYKYLWSLVQLNNNVADTQKVSQLLLTSGLHIDVLGYIWNLANKAVPGQLTKQEFFIVLALVGLAQTGCTFNNISVLKVLPAPTIPILQISALKSITPQPSMPGSEPNTFQEFQSCSVSQPRVNHHFNLDIKESENFNNFNKDDVSFHHHNNTFNAKKEKPQSSFAFEDNSANKNNELHLVDSKKGSYKNSNFPCIGSSPTAEMEDDFTEFQSVPATSSETYLNSNSKSCDKSDDFTEFQSANIDHSDPFETVVISQRKEIPKIPLPKTFTGKLTSLKSNILKISPESERKLKIISKPESLSSLPESKISTNNKVSTSISVLGTNQEIGSRLANHSLGAKLDRPRHHKHHKIKINPNPVVDQQKEEVILGVKTSNIQTFMPKCCPKKSISCKTFILKESKIRSDEVENQVGENHKSEPVIAGENTRQIEIPMLGTFNETVLPTQVKPQSSGIDLISVQEDKYSALREIDLEFNHEQSKPAANVEEMDDFGDFLSADIPPPPPPIETPVSVSFDFIPSAPVSETSNSLLSTIDFSNPAITTSPLTSNTPSGIPTSLTSPSPAPIPSSLTPATPAPVPSSFASPIPAPIPSSLTPPTPAPTPLPTYSPLFDSSIPFQNDISISSVNPNSVLSEPTQIDAPSLLFDPSSEPKTKKEQHDEDWGDWNFNTETKPKFAESFDSNTSTSEKQKSDIFDSFNLLSLNENQSVLKSSTEAGFHTIQNEIFSSLEPNHSSGVLSLTSKEDIINSVPLDSDKTDKTNDLFFQPQSEIINKSENQSNMFWDFGASNVKAPVGEDLSRNGSLQSLDLKMPTSEETEQEVVWRKCLDSCQSIIQEGFDIFNNIPAKSVLNEVFAFEKTSDYLNHLNIAYQVSKRISQNSNDFSSFQENLEKLWNRLEELCFEYNVELKPDLDHALVGTTQCSICLRFINNDVISKGNGNYHPSCANLYINFIENTLPFSS